MSTPSTTQELFAAMPDTFDADAAGDLEATIQFELTGDGGGAWAVAVANGQCTVQKGPADSPSVTLTMDADDFMAMSKGELNPMTAFMSGKIKLEGDMGLAMRLQNLFNLG